MFLSVMLFIGEERSKVKVWGLTQLRHVMWHNITEKYSCTIITCVAFVLPFTLITYHKVKDNGRQQQLKHWQIHVTNTPMLCLNASNSRKYCSSCSFVSPEGITVGKPDNTVSFSSSSESPQRLFAPQRRLHFFFCEESELSSEASSTETLCRQSLSH